MKPYHRQVNATRRYSECAITHGGSEVGRRTVSVWPHRVKLVVRDSFPPTADWNDSLAMVRLDWLVTVARHSKSQGKLPGQHTLVHLIHQRQPRTAQHSQARRRTLVPPQMQQVPHARRKRPADVNLEVVHVVQPRIRARVLRVGFFLGGDGGGGSGEEGQSDVAHGLCLAEGQKEGPERAQRVGRPCDAAVRSWAAEQGVVGLWVRVQDGGWRTTGEGGRPVAADRHDACAVRVSILQLRRERSGSVW